MTLNELRYAVAVARERHFGRAAEKCFVSQPSLSVAIRKLEEELGVTLFERSHAEVRTTEIGQRVIEQAQRVLEEAQRLKTLASQGKDQLAGVLHLGVIHTIAPYLLPGLILQLRRHAPAMPLEIEENMTARLDEQLKNGALDLMLIALPYGEPGIETEVLYEEPLRLVVPPGHKWAKRKHVRREELAGEELLLLSLGHCFRDNVLEACSEFSRPAPQGKQGNSIETLRSMVASGLGISVFPACAFPPGGEDGLVKAIDFAPPAPVRQVALAWRKGYARPQALQVVADCVRALKLPGMRVPGTRG